MAYGNEDENFYYGAPSSLESSFGTFFTGYKMKPSDVGMPTSPGTADQISAVSARLRQGMKTIEMSVASPDLFEEIPKQHFKEINRLAKLTGAEITFHTPFSPTIDTVGFNERGVWSESNRKEAEGRLKSVIEKLHDANPKGNVPITIHATHMPSIEYSEGKKDEMWVVNQSSGEVSSVKARKHYFPGHEDEPKTTPERELAITNNSMWISQTSQLEDQQRHLELAYNDINKDIMNSSKKMQSYIEKVNRKEQLTGEEKRDAQEQQMRLQQLGSQINSISRGYEDLAVSLNSAYSRAYELSDERARELLKKTAEKYNETIEGAQKSKNPIEVVEKLSEASETILKTFRAVDPETRRPIITPKTYVPVEDFAREKASTTIADLAAASYKKFGEKANTLAIENFHPNMAFARAEQLNDLIKEARKKFEKKVIEEQHVNEGEAKRQAEKLIGATWDVGHINMLRSRGFKKEQIIAETEKIAKNVKKLHLTDNFGFHDSHLSPGMGNVPTKEIMKKLEKEGFTGKAIVESGALEAQFKVPGYPYALEAMGSTLYYPIMAPYWSVPPGRAATLPEPYMAGFAPIPKELGGGATKKEGYVPEA